MRRINWLLVLVFFVAIALMAGCADLFTPSGCTKNIYVTDSVRQFTGSDTSWQVDTLAQFVFCMK